MDQLATRTMPAISFDCTKMPKTSVFFATAQLHYFSDGSESGYGRASYLRLTGEDGHVHCAFMKGTSRVTPLKQTTFPRRELTAADCCEVRQHVKRQASD